MILLWIAIIIGLGAFTQAVTGFGFALVTMPPLVFLLTPIPAAALVALAATVAQLILISRYRLHFNTQNLWRIALGIIIGIPVGIRLLVILDESVILTALGVFLVCYTLYSLLTPNIPYIKGNRWDVPIGFTSGVLGGAFNTGGPPVVAYSVGKRWEPIEHKMNLQVLGVVGSATSIALRLSLGHFTVDVLQAFLVAIPATLIGIWVGFKLDGMISPTQFRRLVLIMLLIIGICMIFF